jgi:thioredoxin reductase/NAD-dependent dihydropyrimidine dehydrogenase PreA subunit
MSIPLYAFQSKVLTQYELSIGRDPASELYLEDKSVDRHHAKISWKGTSFSIRDLGQRGTYVGGHRVIEKDLEDGDIIDVGIYKLTVSIEGIRCSIDVLQTRPDAVESFVAESSGKRQYRTVFRVAVPEALRQNAPGMAADREKGRAEMAAAGLGERRSVHWVPPLETVPSWRLPLVVATALFAVFALSGVFIAFGGWPVQSHALSTAHDNEIFGEIAAKSDTSGGCLGCHQPFRGVTTDSCTNCHQRDMRSGHQMAAKAGKDKAPDNCASCHGEHKDLATLRANVQTQCKTCHDGRHTAHGLNAPPSSPKGLEKAPEDAKFRAVLANVPAGTKAFKKAVATLHKDHDDIQRRCAGCHANEKLTEKIDPRSSCMRCHGSVEKLAGDACADCHSTEHPTAKKDWVAATLGRTPKEVERTQRTFASVSALSTIGWSGLWSFLVFLPIAFIFFAHKAVSRRGKLPPNKEDEDHRDDWHEEWMVDIDPEKCIGDGACLVCPYNVIVMDLEVKQAFAKFPGACHGCRACEKRCPARAITTYKIAEGLPSRSFADLTPHYEVVGRPGLFLIGQVTMFKPLMKNAINLGASSVKYVIQHGAKPGTAAAEGFDHELVVIGAGPGGTSAGIEAKNFGLSVRVFEKGDNFAATHRLMMEPDKYLQANPASIENIGTLPLFTGVKQVKDVLPAWEEALEKSGLQIDYGHEVVDVQPHGDGFTVTTNKEVSCTALKVIVAIGGLGTPRKPRCRGSNLPKVRHFMTDRSEFQDKDILVSGAGNAGLETIQALADPALGNRVALQYHKPFSTANASPENIQKVLDLAKRDVNPVKIMAPFNLEEIHEDRVVLVPIEARGGPAPAKLAGPCVPARAKRPPAEAKKAPETKPAPADPAEPPPPKEPVELPNDFVFACIGAVPPTKWLEQIGVNFAQKPANWNPGPTDDLAFLEEE